MTNEEARKVLVEAIEALVDSPEDEEHKMQEFLWMDIEKAVDTLEDVYYDAGYTEGYDAGEEATLTAEKGPA